MHKKEYAYVFFICLFFTHVMDHLYADKLNVRLTLSSQSNYGRVEVQRVDEDGKLGIWGGICDNGFGDTEAGVVCRQLGYRYGLAKNEVYRDHKSTFVLDKITCSGNETMLSQCSHSTWLEHHCVSYQNYYAGVCCSNDSSFGDYVNDTFVSHCQTTWLEAKATCDELDSDIIDVSPNMYSFLNETITYWSSKVYTPWIGLVGCFEIPTVARNAITMKTFSGPGTCAQICYNDGNFGLSALMRGCLGREILEKQIPDDEFLQHTDPSEQKQCAVLENAPVTGHKMIKSAECSAKYKSICESISNGMSQFVNPGDEVNFETSRQLCHNHTLSLAGIMAIDEEYFRLNGPSWIDILRYRVESAAFNDLVFQPKWCLVTSVDTKDGKDSHVVDCQTRHLFICEKVRYPRPSYDSDGTTEGLNSTSIPLSVIKDAVYTSSPTVQNTTVTMADKISFPFWQDKQMLILIVILSSCALVLLVLCTASICICIRRRRKHTSTQHVYSVANQSNADADALSDRTEKANQPYNNPYDTIRDSCAYTEIVENTETQCVTQLHTRNGSIDLSQNPATPDYLQLDPEGHETVELGENYTEPNDAILARKPKLKQVKSSHSYTYPYDSLDRPIDQRKTQSTT